jgi:hypothetical protein
MVHGHAAEKRLAESRSAAFGQAKELSIDKDCTFATKARTLP